MIAQRDSKRHSLSDVHHHVERLSTDNGVHEDVELVEATNRATDGVPEREQERDRRERLLAARQLIGVLVARALLRRLQVIGLDLQWTKGVSSASTQSPSRRWMARTNPERKRALLMVKNDSAQEAADQEVLLECDFGADGDVAPKLIPLGATQLKGCHQCLSVRIWSGQL